MSRAAFCQDLVFVVVVVLSFDNHGPPIVMHYDHRVVTVTVPFVDLASRGVGMPIQPSPSPAPRHPAYAVEDSAATVKAAKPIALNMCDSFIRVGSLLRRMLRRA